MLVVAVPGVVVRDTIHVGVELATVIDVHVGNEYCAMRHLFHC